MSRIGEAMEEIRRAQQRGLKVYGETCPQYLVLTEKDLEGLNMEGAKYVCSPPPRDEASQQACWHGLQQGVFSLFSSDHCPFRYDDPKGKLVPKGRTSFRWVPNGIPGVETRLPILFSEGVGKGRITLNEFVALTATNHARTYGLYPKKGTIAVGADADIAIWDPEREVTISQSLMHGGIDYTPYEGIAVKGWPVSTMVRGQFVVRDGNSSASRAWATTWRARSRNSPGPPARDIGQSAPDIDLATDAKKRSRPHLIRKTKRAGTARLLTNGARQTTSTLLRSGGLLQCGDAPGPCG